MRPSLVPSKKNESQNSEGITVYTSAALSVVSHTHPGDLPAQGNIAFLRKAWYILGGFIKPYNQNSQTEIFQVSLFGSEPGCRNILVVQDI